jgi:hypothetical protein
VEYPDGSIFYGVLDKKTFLPVSGTLKKRAIEESFNQSRIEYESIYEGQFVDDMYEGEGSIYYFNGDIY